MKTLASIFILFFSYNAALACSCANTGDAGKDKAIMDSPAIFQGKVISTKSDWFDKSRDIEVKFQVLRAWKGVEENEIIVETPSDPASCGYSFEEGSTYTVYANPRHTITCTMRLVDEKRLREKLGEGKSFEESSQQEGFFSWLWRKITSVFS